MFLTLSVAWNVHIGRKQQSAIQKRKKEATMQKYIIDSLFWLVIGRAHRGLSGPGCSKLTTSLFKETLKFQTSVSQISHIFY